MQLSANNFILLLSSYLSLPANTSYSMISSYLSLPANTNYSMTSFFTIILTFFLITIPMNIIYFDISIITSKFQ